MDKLVLTGGGGHCKSVIESALKMNRFDEIVITDPLVPVGTNILGCKVVGTDDILPSLRKDGFDYAFITVGSIGINPLRIRLAEELSALGFAFPVIVDPSAVFSDSASLEPGVFVGKSVTINAEAKIGKHCIINTGSIIEHECIVNDYSHISVGAVLCGETVVGSNCLIGAGATIIQCRRIGNNCIVGAGAVVKDDFSDGCTVIGVPARIVREQES